MSGLVSISGDDCLMLMRLNAGLQMTFGTAPSLLCNTDSVSEDAVVVADTVRDLAKEKNI